MTSHLWEITRCSTAEPSLQLTEILAARVAPEAQDSGHGQDHALRRDQTLAARLHLGTAVRAQEPEAAAMQSRADLHVLKALHHNAHEVQPAERGAHNPGVVRDAGPAGRRTVQGQVLHVDQLHVCAMQQRGLLGR